MKPEVKVFSKENPCTKLDLWTCFKRSAKGFARVQVDEAYSIIGKNAPRVMERNGYLERVTVKQEEMFKLTAEGEAWLEKGITAYRKNHPKVEIPFGVNNVRARIVRPRARI